MKQYEVLKLAKETVPIMRVIINQVDNLKNKRALEMIQQNNTDTNNRGVDEEKYPVLTLHNTLLMNSVCQQRVLRELIKFQQQMKEARSIIVTMWNRGTEILVVIPKLSKDRRNLQRNKTRLLWLKDLTDALAGK